MTYYAIQRVSDGRFYDWTANEFYRDHVTPRAMYEKEHGAKKDACDLGIHEHRVVRVRLVVEE